MTSTLELERELEVGQDTQSSGASWSGRIRVLKPGVIISLLVLIVVVLWALVPGWFAHQDPEFGDSAEKFLAPSWGHLFGTDHQGRDLFARVVFGTRSSVSTALIAVLIGLFVGGLVGLVAGYIGRITDVVLSRLVDVLLAIPSFLLAVVIVSVLGFQTVNAAIATGISAVAIFARLSRSEVLKVRKSVFVEASKLQGGSKLSILFEHILPNSYRSVLSLAILEFGGAVLTIAGLAFLGYGDPPPASDWGLLISEGRKYNSAPWLTFIPAAAVVITVLAINRLSRWIRKVDQL